MKFFKKTKPGYPPDPTLEEWKDILDKIILSFELILDTSEPNFGEFGEHKWHIENSRLVVDSDSTFDSEAYIKWHKDRQKTIEEGLKLFAEYFQDL